MTTEITTPENAEPTNTLTVFQQSALDAAEKELETMRKELNTKKYLIDVKKEDIALLVKFNEKDAEWKFTECLGILEVEKQLNIAVKEGKLYTTAVAIEAMYYYLSKIEGRGKGTDTEAFTSIVDFIRVLKAITNGVERIKADNEKLRNQEFIVAARREGINTDDSAEDAK
jgi:hypothetical protein